MYCVSSGWLLLLLYSYIGRALARNGFRLITTVHQLIIIAIFFFWKLCSSNGILESWPVFRGAVLYGCATGEMGAVVLDISAALREIGVQR